MAKETKMSRKSDVATSSLCDPLDFLSVCCQQLRSMVKFWNDDATLTMSDHLQSEAHIQRHSFLGLKTTCPTMKKNTPSRPGIPPLTPAKSNSPDLQLGTRSMVAATCFFFVFQVCGGAGNSEYLHAQDSSFSAKPIPVHNANPNPLLGPNLKNQAAKDLAAQAISSNGKQNQQEGLKPVQPLGNAGISSPSGTHLQGSIQKTLQKNVHPTEQTPLGSRSAVSQSDTTPATGLKNQNNFRRDSLLADFSSDYSTPERVTSKRTDSSPKNPTNPKPLAGLGSQKDQQVSNPNSRSLGSNNSLGHSSLGNGSLGRRTSTSLPSGANGSQQLQANSSLSNQALSQKTGSPRPGLPSGSNPLQVNSLPPLSAGNRNQTQNNNGWNAKKLNDPIQTPVPNSHSIPESRLVGGRQEDSRLGNGAMNNSLQTGTAPVGGQSATGNQVRNRGLENFGRNGLQDGYNSRPAVGSNRPLDQGFSGSRRTETAGNGGRNPGTLQPNLGAPTSNPPAQQLPNFGNSDLQRRSSQFSPNVAHNGNNGGVGPESMTPGNNGQINHSVTKAHQQLVQGVLDEMKSRGLGGIALNLLPPIQSRASDSFDAPPIYVNKSPAANSTNTDGKNKQDGGQATITNRDLDGKNPKNDGESTNLKKGQTTNTKSDQLFLFLFIISLGANVVFGYFWWDSRQKFSQLADDLQSRFFREH